MKQNKYYHFETKANFNSQKLSANSDNTLYTVGADTDICIAGTPDISYDSICYIKETSQIWTHGNLYHCTKVDDTLETRKNYVKVRKDSATALGNGELAGIEVENYDGRNNNLRLAVDGNGVARVGDVGDERPIAVRSESANLHTGGIMTWNSDTQSMDERVGNLRPIILPNLNYNEVGSTTSTADFLEKLLKYIVSNYNSGANTEKLFITASTPNSRGITIIHMYSSANYNSTGLPQYCSGIFNELSSNGGIIRFGTWDGQFWIDVPTRIWKGSASQLPSSLASNSLYFII